MEIFNSSDWIALFSGIVALCAFFVSIYSVHATNKHNKLSAKPLFRINFTVQPGEVSATLHNVGLGPGFLDKLQFRHNENIYNFFDNSFINFLDLFQNETPLETNFKAQKVPKGTAISVGQEFLLFRILEPSSNQENLDRITKSLAIIQSKMKYRSIYGESFGDA